MKKFKQSIIYSVALFLTAIFLSACVKTTTVTTPSKNSENTVQVLYSPPTDRAYTELGLINTQTGQTIFHDRSNEGMIEKLKIEAEKLNADAIIIRSAKEGTWGLKGDSTGFDRGNAEAIAIKFSNNQTEKNKEKPL